MFRSFTHFVWYNIFTHSPAKPRATVEVRNDGGQSLLSIAAQFDFIDLAMFLLTHYKTIDADRWDLNPGTCVIYFLTYKCIFDKFFHWTVVFAHVFPEKTTNYMSAVSISHGLLCNFYMAGELSMEAKIFKPNVNSRDLKGWSCACICVFHDSRRVLQALLEHGADPNIRSSYNKNAWDLAKVRNANVTTIFISISSFEG